jgi:YidC/Oxa1 family membrane protein insertase
MEEKNFILFVILAFGIIFLWSIFLAPKPKKKPPAPAPAQEQPVQTGNTPVAVAPQTLSDDTATKVAVGLYEKPAVKPAPVPAEPLAEALPEVRVTVRTKVYTIEFTNRGALPLSWKLNDYKTRLYYPYEINPKWPPLEKVPPFEPELVDLAGEKLGPDRKPFRSAIKWGQGKENFIPPDAVWEVDEEDLVVEEGDSKSLVFRYSLGDGREVQKIFKFSPDKHFVEFRVATKGLDPEALQGSKVWLGMSFLFEPLNRLSRINFNGPVIHTGEKLVQIKLKDLEKPDSAVELAGIDWAGFTDSYFLGAILKEGPETFSWSVRYTGDPALIKDKKAAKEYSGEVLVIPASTQLDEGQLAALKLFMGPKRKNILVQARNSLQFAIDYGMLKILVVPLMAGLNLIDKLFHNYGVSIIVLTVLLRMIMFPFTRKGQESMKEMTKLQPEMKTIREKYAGDRMKQQEEMAALYKRYKINPMGGCLPMVIQIPIFFAFYKALLISIELRHAPFFGWINDLSSRDPLLILPLLMGGSQIIMQKMTPTTGDPTQAKMMMLMPIVFVFLLLYFPSGLLLYWTVSNIVGIGQQIYVNKTKK